MGVICPCGVKVNALIQNHRVQFTKRCKLIRGNLTYLAYVCSSKLKTSKLQLTFEEEEQYGNNNFVFNAKEITSVDCKQKESSCIVTVKGTGVVNEKEYPFEGVFIDTNSQIANDVILSFKILGFFDQNGILAAPQGSIVAIGCQEV